MEKVKIVLKKQNVQTNKIYEDIVEFDESINFLDLSNQNIIEIPKGLEQFKNLKILYLYNNNISKIQFLTADAKPFNKNHLIHLKTLDLTKNQITKIENLDNLIHLKALVLNNNQITKFENLDNLINLTYLNLSKNQISKIENLDNNINLEILYLQNNQINKIENLDNNINLKELDLSNNKITKIENIHHLEKLEYFWLFNFSKSENIEESKQISLSNKEIELKEIQIQKQIQEELLKQQKQIQEKEYYDNNFDKFKQQFITSNNPNNDLLIWNIFKFQLPRPKGQGLDNKTKKQLNCLIE